MIFTRPLHPRVTGHFCVRRRQLHSLLRITRRDSFSAMLPAWRRRTQNTPSKRALVGKAGSQCRFGKRQAAVAKHRLCRLDAPMPNSHRCGAMPFDFRNARGKMAHRVLSSCASVLSGTLPSRLAGNAIERSPLLPWSKDFEVVATTATSGASKSADGAIGKPLSVSVAGNVVTERGNVASSHHRPRCVFVHHLHRRG